MTDKIITTEQLGTLKDVIEDTIQYYEKEDLFNMDLYTILEIVEDILGEEVNESE